MIIISDYCGRPSSIEEENCPLIGPFEEKAAF